MATTTRTQHNPFTNCIVHGNCIDIMQQMPEASVDFIFTDPPYLVGFRDRQGRTLQSDTPDGKWLKPAMEQAHRVLKPNRVMLCFYGWPRAEKYIDAWKQAGFHPIGHMIFRKSYTSKTRFLRGQHEQAYLLAKGNPPLPKDPLSDMQHLVYTGNTLHPTQKAVTSLVPVIRAFSHRGEVVLDAFAGSGSTCAAALLTGAAISESNSILNTTPTPAQECSVFMRGLPLSGSPPFIQQSPRPMRARLPDELSQPSTLVPLVPSFVRSGTAVGLILRPAARRVSASAHAAHGFRPSQNLFAENAQTFCEPSEKDAA